MGKLQVEGMPRERLRAKAVGVKKTSATPTKKINIKKVTPASRRRIVRQATERALQSLQNKLEQIAFKFDRIDREAQEERLFTTQLRQLDGHWKKVRKQGKLAAGKSGDLYPRCQEKSRSRRPSC